MNPSCPTEKTRFPIKIEVGASIVVIHLSDHSEHTEPMRVEVSAFPCLREPEINARQVVALLVFYLKNRYSQMRKMSPEFAQTVDDARKSKTCSSALTVLTSGLHPSLFAMVCPFLIKLIRTRTFDPFYPQGVEYAAWFMGRCIMQAKCENSRLFAQSIRKLILSPHITAQGQVSPGSSFP